MMNLKKANNFFKNGQFEMAISAYQEIAKRNDFFLAMLNLNIQIAKRKMSSKRDRILNTVGSQYLCGVNIGSLSNSWKIITVINAFCFISQIKESQQPEITVASSSNAFDTCGSSIVCQFAEQTIKISSSSYSGRFALRISIEANYNNEDVQFDAYQYDAKMGGHLILVGSYLIKRDDKKIIELNLYNHYKPILILIKNSINNIIDAAFIPFPSIFPGGRHENEMYYSRLGAQILSENLYSQYTDAFRSKESMLVTELYVDLNSANSTELIFQNETLEWLWEVFSLRLKGINNLSSSKNLKDYWSSKLLTPASVRSAEKFNTQSYREKRGVALYLTRNSLPTVTILTSGISKLPTNIGFLYHNEVDENNFWYIRQIPNREIYKESDGVSFPYLLRKQDGFEKKGEAPISIEFGTEVEYLMRNKKYIYKKINIMYILQSDCLDNLAASLESFALQMEITIGVVLFVLENKDDAKEIKKIWRKLSDSPLHFVYVGDVQSYFPAVRSALESEFFSEESDWLFINSNPILKNVYDLNNLQSILSKKNVDIVSPVLSTNSAKSNFRGVSVKRINGHASYQPIVDEKTPILDSYIYTASVSDNIFMLSSDNFKVLNIFKNPIYKNIEDFMIFSIDLLTIGCKLVVYDRVVAVVQKNSDFRYIGYEKLIPFENIENKLTIFESYNK